MILPEMCGKRLDLVIDRSQCNDCENFVNFVSMGALNFIGNTKEYLTELGLKTRWNFAAFYDRDLHENFAKRLPKVKSNLRRQHHSLCTYEKLNVLYAFNTKI